MVSQAELLKRSVWAKVLAPADLERACAATMERLIPAGDMVVRKGEPVQEWVGVLDGLVKISNVAANGKSATLTGVPAGGWMGEGSLLKQEPRKYDVVALRDSRVAFMPRETFFYLMDHSLSFARFLITQLNERLGQFISIVEHDRLLDTDARVARCLAEMFNPILYPGNERCLRISQEEIGFLSGVSRQRVNQAMQALAKAGLLEVEYGCITVLDLPGLRSYGN